MSFSPEILNTRPTVLEVDLDAIDHNLQQVRAHVRPAKVMAIVKANAYGHGLTVCGRFLEKAGADYLGVAFVEEGVQLRLAGVEIPILVMGGILDSQIGIFLENDLDITASSISKLEAIEATAAEMGRVARVHLKIDTGMERIGIHYYNASRLFEKAVQTGHCEIMGVYSHFAMTSRQDLDFTKTQLERFLGAISFFEDNGLPIPARHIANSAGLLSLPDAHLDMVRPGVVLYGVNPSTEYEGTLALHPALTLRSKVVYFKVVPAGVGVSYGHKWIAPEECRVVTVPIGYGDGYFRQLTNKGIVLIRGKKFPIVGAVCMDQFMVNIGWDEAYNGDEVILIGRQGENVITVEDVAEMVGTDPREVLISTNQRVPRRYLSTDPTFDTG